jgi:kumamolisin
VEVFVKQRFWQRLRPLLQGIAGLILVGALLSACSTPGGSSSTPANNTNNGQGVTPMPTSGPRVVSDRPPAANKLPQGTPLPGNELKPLTFNLLYNDAALEQATAQIYTPGSATYHQFLSPAQIVQNYAESAAQLNTVKSWLTQHGFRIIGVDALRSSISVQASVSAIEKSLGVQLQAFNVLGHEFFMQVGNPVLSGEVAGLVQSITGLDNFALPIFKPPFSALQGDSSAQGGANCSKYGAKLSLTRDRLAAVYQGSALYRQGYQGQGMAIGVAEFDEPYDPQDVANYAACAGVGAPHIQNVQVDGATAAGSGQGEAALDLELITGLAPRAQVLDYQVGTNSGNIAFAQALVDLFTRVATDRRVQVLSVSYGSGDGSFSSSEQDAVNRELRTLAAEGISVFISSGDCGAFSQRVSNIAMVSFPASAPYAIAVGGTHLQVNAGSTRTSEDVWGNNDGAAYCQNEWGSGGGVSQNPDFRRPSWQVGPGTTSHYDGTSNLVLTSTLTPVEAPNGLRQVPDIAAAAYPNIAIYYQGTWYAFGGTSAAAPIWAAGALLVDQGLKSHGKAALGGVPTFYTLANHAGSLQPYTDITQGNNLFYPATRGWDYATGWGSPNLNTILQMELSL